MINIFNEIYTALVNALSTDEKTSTLGVENSSVYVNMPSKYPFVSMEEIDNSVYEKGSDCCEVENFANVYYEVNIYTRDPLKKTNGNTIAEVVDNLLKSYGFVREYKNPIQSSDETIYRIIMRYHGVVSKDHTIYRR